MTRLLVELTAIVEVGEIDAIDEAIFVRDSSLDVERGIVEWSQTHVTRIVTPADATCDFCGSREPVFNYPASDFPIGEIVPGVAEGSTGGWLACGPCSALIEASDYHGLTRRSLKSYEDSHSVFPEDFRADTLALLKEMHEGFRQNRNGDRIPLTEGVPNGSA